MTDSSERYRALAEEFTRRVESAPAGSWESPSPCEGWTARDVLRHVVEVHRDLPSWAGLVITLEKSVDDDPAGAWAEARDTVQDLLEDPARAGKEYDGLLGRTTAEATIDRFVCFDLLVHGWDLARATGQDETLPAAEVKRVHADALALGDNIRREGVCGPEVTVGEDASDQDRLLAYLGRRP
ncbi:TIGR03086 family metal-binding protein [Saccharopolyspora taberi]|uniref:Maleylpyruvate isomerase family mycothiol-dependent enzyme n=1 Tax=Saccharopolyspora taberi TaxID=60895 RepID=A0ABN3VGH7_9PSEU